MSRARRTVDCPREPIGLSLDEAATYVGMSGTLFQQLVDKDLMPRPRQAGRRLIWVAPELERALLRLPVAGRSGQVSGAEDDKWNNVAA